MLNTALPIVKGGTGGTSVITGWDGLASLGSDIASGASINLQTATGPSLTITGTASISTVTLNEGKFRLVRAGGAFTLTAGASLLVNGSASGSLTVTAEDLLLFRGGAAGVVSVVTLNGASESEGRNRWVNPSFQVSQENGNTLGTATGYYPADQIAMLFVAATAAMSVQRVQSSRSLNGSIDKIEYKCTTAKVSLGGSDVVRLSQPIEGQEMADLQWGTANAEPYVFEFEIQAPQGLYHVHVTNSAANRHIAVPFTIASGENNTAVRKIVTIPGDTSGTWLTDNGIGAVIDIVLAAGATVTGGTLNTWGSTTYYAQSTQKNILDANTNVVRLADVILAADFLSTGAAPAWEAPSYADTLRKAQRYYYRITYSAVAQDIATNQAFDTASVGGGVVTPVAPSGAMRATPSVSFSAVGDFLLYTAGGISAAVSAMTLGATPGGGITIASASRTGSGLVAGNASIMRTNSSAAWFAANARM